jgi:hypothetical protein
MKKGMKTKWIIKVSGEVNFLVKQGEEVDNGQLLARLKSKLVESFNFSDFFGKLGQEKLEELNEKFKNTWVNSGELLCLTGGIFPNKICFPMSGNFLEIDEFGNLKIEKIEDKEKEIKAPVDSKIIKIEDDKIVLEFEAQEFKGEGIVEGKSWGKGVIRVINEMKDLSSLLEGSILFTDNSSKSFLLKAEVVGINAVVTNKPVDIDDIRIGLPFLKLDDDAWVELMKHEGEEKSILVNSRVGRLLMVLE